MGKAALAAAAADGVDSLEAEGLRPGLDWYGTNAHADALFAGAGQHAGTTSDSEYDREHDGEGEEGEWDASDGGGGSGEGGLPRGVQARLVEQEAYIAELEDQNLRWVVAAGGGLVCWVQQVLVVAAWGWCVRLCVCASGWWLAGRLQVLAPPLISTLLPASNWKPAPCWLPL